MLTRAAYIWMIDATGKFVITRTGPKSLAIWKKTKSGDISKANCGRSIANDIQKIPAVAKYVKQNDMYVYRDHVCIKVK